MELRPATREEFDDFGRAVLAAFHRELTEEDRRHYARVDEPERSLAWFDDGRIVAGTGIYSRHVTVPGAVVPCAAVTAVGVLPTHRRRGLLTSMMRRQLEDVHARGEPLAILWASEGAIYGRFGYGIAAREARLTARRPAARLAARPPAGDPLRAGPAADHVEHMRAVYERVRGERPGLLDRPGPWWERAPVRPRVAAPRRPAAAGPRSCPTAMRCTPCAPTATTKARRARCDPRARRGDAGGARAAVGLPARPGPDADRSPGRWRRPTSRCG